MKGDGGMREGAKEISLTKQQEREREGGGVVGWGGGGVVDGAGASRTRGIRKLMTRRFCNDETIFDAKCDLIHDNFLFHYTNLFLMFRFFNLKWLQNVC